MPKGKSVPPTYLKLREATDYVRRANGTCSVNTVKRALVTGDLRGHQARPGGEWAIHTDDLDTWIASRDVVAQAEALRAGVA